MKKANNIILIGMPGSGKSTIGEVLAKKLEMEFIDTDDIITNMTATPLQNILETKGLEEFLNTEKEAILTLNCENTVISTGGSVILREQSMAHLKTLGKIIYLRLPFCAINNRIKNFETRGIARNPGETLWTIYNNRISLYEKYCDVKINCNQKTVNKVLNRIMNYLKEE